MTVDFAIRVEGLGKRYQIGAEWQRYRTFRESLRDTGRRFRRRGTTTEFWALQDVTLEVAPGDVLGIIGRNGAGKSTLLKILARITEPTTGFAEIRGRVGSLLEVGSGFNMELTGRENVYLNGAILGMRRKEIDRKFDEIVAFAEVSRFVDTPVKRYSTGMYMRLAFAVAAHLEPEVLLVDEVLAVGDAEFQRKCLGKMGDVARHGRTILFVSHNLEAIQRLCSHSIWVDAGEIRATGPSEDLVTRFLSETRDVVERTPLRDRSDRLGDGSFRFSDVSVKTASDRGAGYDLALHVRGMSTRGGPGSLDLSATIRHERSGVVATLSNIFEGQTLRSPGAGEEVSFVISSTLPLLPGPYEIDLWSGAANQTFDFIESAATIVLPGADTHLGLARTVQQHGALRATCSIEVEDVRRIDRVAEPHDGPNR